jgi:hypothetical protein
MTLAADVCQPPRDFTDWDFVSVGLHRRSPVGNTSACVFGSTLALE